MVAQHYRWDFIGLSTDNKPTPETSPKVVDGSTFYCSDTSKLYVFCKDTWYEKVVEGGGTTYTAGDGIDITNAIISATNTGKPRVLTTADYNYPTDNPTYIAAWLLEPGFYVTESSNVIVKAAKTSASVAYTIYERQFIVGEKSNSRIPLFAITSVFNVGAANLVIYSLKDDGSSSYNISGILDKNFIVNNLTSGGAERVLSAEQGKVLKDLIDSLVIKNAGAPTTATVGTVGQLLEDTTNGKLYQCTAIDNTDPQSIVYTWSEVGGAGITPVQTTGTSTTDVMSQNATTSMIYASPADKKHIQIGENSKAQGSDDSISIGFSSSTIGDYSMALGRGASVPSTGRCAVAIGQTASASGPYSVALGAEARTGNVRGVVAIGVLTANGYNSSNYRLITGVYDGQSAHDAATYGQLSTAIINGGTTAPTTATVGAVGTLYSAVVSNTAHLYVCTAIDDTTDPQNPSYTWTTLV